MNNQVEGVVVPATYPPADYGGQVAVWADSWVREWRSCLGTVMNSGESVTIGALVFFRGDTLERLRDDDGWTSWHSGWSGLPGVSTLPRT